jgi:hypothetical protein
MKAPTGGLRPSRAGQSESISRLSKSTSVRGQQPAVTPIKSSFSEESNENGSVTGQISVKGATLRTRTKGVPPPSSPLAQSASLGALSAVKRPLSSNYGQRAKKGAEDISDDVSVISTGSTVVSTVVSSRSRPVATVTAVPAGSNPTSRSAAALEAHKARMERRNLAALEKKI